MQLHGNSTLNDDICQAADRHLHHIITVEMNGKKQTESKNVCVIQHF